MEKTIYSRDYEIFLACLKEAREAAGITQQQLAESLGKTQTFVSKCERGERRIDIVEARTFCTALNIPFQKFVAAFESNLPKESRARRRR